jgi:hypothetical protein
MKYFKIKCNKCGKIERLIFDESSKKISDDREIKILIINGEKWIDGLIPPLEDFCFGDCSQDLNLIGQVQKFIIKQLRV